MERLQKVIANAGVTSRRKAEELIKEGVVKVNGVVVTELGTKVSGSDKVEVRGVALDKEEPVYFLFFKPKGVISSVSDEKGRAVVTDYFKGEPERIYPVGRLDWDTSGLLLMTNDGDFANAMMHPKHEIDKVYTAKVKGLADKINLRPLTLGVKIDGRITAPARYNIISVNPENDSSIVELRIHEGRNHQVKKMFEAVGLPVKTLKRDKFGDLDLTGLRIGEYRKLSKKEVSRLLNYKSV
ncbi:MAG: rRNA pseudouridine synthase [Lactobacillales bacterium]|jgi:23S rRNA pseudouridine2605 synthase|nr:rRNA pseudouridine synthase [Lactobacillales bacterium]